MQELNQKRFLLELPLYANTIYVYCLYWCNKHNIRAKGFLKGLYVLMASSLRQVLHTYSEICIFCSAIQYIVFRNSQWKVHMKCWQNL